ncbi:MAG: IPExxxVDY family protein [Flavobacteriaceae bacterium]
MPKMTLDLDFMEEESFKLIGIVSVLEDYRLAYFLNQGLGYSLEKLENDLDFKNLKFNSSFSLFGCYNEYSDQEIHLINNKDRVEIEQDQEDLTSLFGAMEELNYLFPEKKQIDYFLKITGELTDQELQQITGSIKELPQVQTAYEVALTELKTIEFLIF